MYSLKRPHRSSRHLFEKASWIVISLLVAGCGSGSNSSAPPSAKVTGTPGAEASVGERLFIETRFAQSFKVFLDHGGDTIRRPAILLWQQQKLRIRQRRSLRLLSKACP